MKLVGSEITEQYDDMGLVFEHKWIGPLHLRTVRHNGMANRRSVVWSWPESWLWQGKTVRHGPFDEHVHLVLVGAHELLRFSDQLDHLWYSPEPDSGIVYRSVPCALQDCPDAACPLARDR